MVRIFSTEAGVTNDAGLCSKNALSSPISCANIVTTASGSALLDSTRAANSVSRSLRTRSAAAASLVGHTVSPATANNRNPSIALGNSNVRYFMLFGICSCVASSQRHDCIRNVVLG